MRYTTLPIAYADLCEHVLTHGRTTSPRGMKTAELIGHSFTLTRPWCNIITSPVRRLNLSFMAAEAIWIIGGFNDARLIVPYNKQLAPYSDDGVTFNGAYGPKIADQLSYIISTLRQDSDSRQALLSLWREKPRASKDIPCTVTMQFFIREEKVEMVTYMRSNDVWLGLPYDVFTFTTLQRYVASALELEMGPYHHHVGSLHLYENNWDKAAKVAQEDVAGQREIRMEGVTYPIPLNILAYFAGFGAWGTSAIDPKIETTQWLNAAGLEQHGWDALIRLCAYRFHQDVNELPAKYLDLVQDWGPRE